MYITWNRTNELGEVITENHPFLTTDNISSYAKHNHKKCNGTGIEHWDSGWEYFTETSEDGYTFISRKPLNPRLIACDCVLRVIDKAGL